MRNREKVTKALHCTDKACVGIVVATYAATLLYLLVTSGVSVAFLKTLLIPLAAYLILSALRSWINAPRPYDNPNFTPLLEPNKSGKSFPSRHVSSGAVIALTVMPVCIYAGVLCLVATLILAYVRVAGGLHFYRDVLCGFCLGCLLGLLALI